MTTSNNNQDTSLATYIFQKIKSLPGGAWIGVLLILFIIKLLYASHSDLTTMKYLVNNTTLAQAALSTFVSGIQIVVSSSIIACLVFYSESLREKDSSSVGGIALLGSFVIACFVLPTLLTFTAAAAGILMVISSIAIAYIWPYIKYYIFRKRKNVAQNKRRYISAKHDLAVVVIMLVAATTTSLTFNDQLWLPVEQVTKADNSISSAYVIKSDDVSTILLNANDRKIHILANSDIKHRSPCASELFSTTLFSTLIGSESKNYYTICGDLKNKLFL